jgi:hypothetical protein
MSPLGAVETAANEVTFKSLLQEMADRTVVTHWPMHPCRSLPASSYNRASKTPDDPIGWFASVSTGNANTREALQGAAGDLPRKTAAILKQEPVDFNHPPRDYVTHKLHGWSVLVEKQLVDEAPKLAKTTLARLENNLGEAVAVPPAATLPDLRKLRIFLLYGPQAKAGGRKSGLEYFRANAPKHQDWFDPRMGRRIVIFNAANYVKISEFWAIKALMHEFGHAQHLEHWPKNRAGIYTAWDHAVKAGLFQTVRGEDKSTHNPNYAAQNHLEYFAELTAIYFVGANY